MIDKTLFNKESDSKKEEFLELLQTTTLKQINPKNISFYVNESTFQKYFNNDEDLTSDDKVFFYPYFQGESSGLNIDKNPIGNYKESKYIIFPVSLEYRNSYRSKFSVALKKNNFEPLYIFSKNWEKYLPLILEGKLKPISFDKYYLKSNIRITEDMIPSLISMILYGSENDREIVQTMLLSFIKTDLTVLEEALFNIIGTALYFRGVGYFKTSKNVSREVNKYVNEFLDKNFFSIYCTYDKSSIIPKELVEKYLKPVYQYKINELTHLYFTINVEAQITKIY
jgi:hypothetical protein